MPTNEIKVEWENGVPKCYVWDSQGNLHDVCDIFEQLRDVTAASRQSTEIWLGHTQNSLQTKVKFEATKKESIFEVPAAVIEQILQMKES